MAFCLYMPKKPAYIDVRCTNVLRKIRPDLIKDVWLEIDSQFHLCRLTVYEDKCTHQFPTARSLQYLSLARSLQYLGLRTQLGLCSLSDYGSDVVIDVLDMGVWPERRSFSDWHWFRPRGGTSVKQVPV
ncbi:Subtilisin-like protease SBT1.6 [Carex littledalei]|uniref:Subtilisin-like protease SBT1.6 n=1 Tax=Carex littledalei TaxID=544730 RepID=A0A833QBG0_9POAL|nr:Subtilisin-like protease SBT1.6 [Carex littledalei]